MYTIELSEKAPRKLTQLPEQSRMVIAAQACLPTDNAHHAYLYGEIVAQSSTAAIPFQVEIYNFHAEKPQRGQVWLVAPPGWEYPREPTTCVVQPLGWQVLIFDLIPHPGSCEEVTKVLVQGSFEGKEVVPSVSYFKQRSHMTSPLNEQTLEWVPAQRWHSHSSSNAVLEVTDIEAGLRIEASFYEEGNHWAYIVVDFEAPLDLNAYEGVALDVTMEEDVHGGWIRLMLCEADGTMYMNGVSTSTQTQRIFLHFEDVLWDPLILDQEKQKRGTKRIISAIIGLNTLRPHTAFHVRNLRAVNSTNYSNILPEP